MCGVLISGTRIFGFSHCVPNVGNGNEGFSTYRAVMLNKSHIGEVRTMWCNLGTHATLLVFDAKLEGWLRIASTVKSMLHEHHSADRHPGGGHLLLVPIRDHRPAYARHALVCKLSNMQSLSKRQASEEVGSGEMQGL